MSLPCQLCIAFFTLIIALWVIMMAFLCTIISYAKFSAWLAQGENPVSLGRDVDLILLAAVLGVLGSAAICVMVAIS